MTSRGKLIVLEGTDGSGKTVQADLLIAHLQRESFLVATLRFPSYEEPSAVPVEMYLRKELGDPKALGPYIPSTWYALDRLVKAITVLEPGLAAGTNFVLNRYTGSNAGHQGGKIADDRERRVFLDWLFKMEFEQMRIPKPDLTVLLHLPAAVGKQLVARKVRVDSAYRTREGEARKPDAHEEDPHHLEQAEAAYLYVAQECPDWKVVKCLNPDLEGKLDEINDPDTPPDKKIRTIDEIHAEVYGLVAEVLRAA